MDENEEVVDGESRQARAVRDGKFLGPTAAHAYVRLHCKAWRPSSHVTRHVKAADCTPDCTLTAVKITRRCSRRVPRPPPQPLAVMNRVIWMGEQDLKRGQLRDYAWGFPGGGRAVGLWGRSRWWINLLSLALTELGVRPSVCIISIKADPARVSSVLSNGARSPYFDSFVLRRPFT
jgi:hypothetical protein